MRRYATAQGPCFVCTYAYVMTLHNLIRIAFETDMFASNYSKITGKLMTGRVYTYMWSTKANECVWTET